MGLDPRSALWLLSNVRPKVVQHSLSAALCSTFHSSCFLYFSPIFFIFSLYSAPLLDFFSFIFSTCHFHISFIFFSCFSLVFPLLFLSFFSHFSCFFSVASVSPSLMVCAPYVLRTYTYTLIRRLSTCKQNVNFIFYFSILSFL